MLPFWGSLRLASSSTGLPELMVNRGLQMAGFLDWSPPSLAVPAEIFFYYPFPVWASLVGGWWEDWVTFLSSTPFRPLPPCAFFHFLSVASTEEVRVGVGVGVGGQVTTGMAGEEPPTWAVSKASRSGVFSSNPMSSGMFVAYWWALTCAGFRHWHEVLEVSLGSSH